MAREKMRILLASQSETKQQQLGRDDCSIGHHLDAAAATRHKSQLASVVLLQCSRAALPLSLLLSLLLSRVLEDLHHRRTTTTGGFHFLLAIRKTFRAMPFKSRQDANERVCCQSLALCCDRLMMS